MTVSLRIQAEAHLEDQRGSRLYDEVFLPSRSDSAPVPVLLHHSVRLALVFAPVIRLHSWRGQLAVEALLLRMLEAARGRHLLVHLAAWSLVHSPLLSLQRVRLVQ